MHVLSSLSSPGISQTLLCPAHRGALSSAASRALPTAVLDFCTWVGDEKIHKSLRPGKFRDESRGSSGMQRCSASPKVPIGKAAAMPKGRLHQSPLRWHPGAQFPRCGVTAQRNWSWAGKMSIKHQQRGPPWLGKEKSP